MNEKTKSLFLVASLILTGCEEKYTHFDYNELKDTVIKVDIIMAEDPILENARKLKTIPQHEIDDFFYDLSQLEFVSPFPNLRYPSGMCFCLYYVDGGYNIVDDSYTNIGEQNYLWCIDREQFQNLLKKYY